MPFRQRIARHLGETVSTAPKDLKKLQPAFFPEVDAAMNRSPSTDMLRSQVKTRNGGGAPQKKYQTASHRAREARVARLLYSTRQSNQHRTCESRVDKKKPTGYSGSRTLTRLRAPQLSPEQKYLSYFDINLTNEDIKCLRGDWLTDNNIAFWEEWLEREILPKYPQARIEMVRPTMSVLLMNVSIDEARAQLPDFKGVTHIFIPVSDIKDVGKAEGGTHWSLLLVSALDRVAFHYDSLGAVNVPEARTLTTRLSALLGMHIRFQNIEDCPQQENGNDCGVFVCILMRHLLVKKLLNANAMEKVNMSMAGKMIDAHGGRKEMLRIIESLRSEGERRRSTSPFARPQVPRID